MFRGTFQVPNLRWRVKTWFSRLWHMWLVNRNNWNNRANSKSARKQLSNLQKKWFFFGKWEMWLFLVMEGLKKESHQNLTTKMICTSHHVQLLICAQGLPALPISICDNFGHFPPWNMILWCSKHISFHCEWALEPHPFSVCRSPPVLRSLYSHLWSCDCNLEASLRCPRTLHHPS